MERQLAGLITTVLNVGPIQKDGKLRWRMASDTSGSGEGWRVDTVNITGATGHRVRRLRPRRR